MIDFLADLVAVMFGFMLLAVGFAYFTADPRVEAYCQIATTNPIDKTGCIIQHTVRNW